LLKIGRHFWVREDTKLVVARDEKEGKELEELAQENDYLFMPNEELAGPTSLGRGKFNQDLINLSCRITCRYCDLNGDEEAVIIIKRGTVPCGDSPSFLKVSPISDTELKSFKI
jgi:hypothetical protein